ncbi:MAG: hypothetical protein HKO64_10485 [Xanthomonadales bacterium]|nr:hypothetical protein [Xanthomonadales bacterium]
MNPKTEIKILREFLKIIDAPEKAEKRFVSYARVAMIICALLIFLLLSDNVDFAASPFVFGACAFAAGVSFGLAIWFLQAGTQTAIMTRHMSRESIEQRMGETDVD